MKLDLNRVLELPGEADVVTADVDLTTVKHAGQPLFTAPVNVTAKAVNRAGVVTLDCTYRFTLHVLCDPLPGSAGAACGPNREPHRGAGGERGRRRDLFGGREWMRRARGACYQRHPAGAAPALPVPGGLQGAVPDLRQEPERGPVRLP